MYHASPRAGSPLVAPNLVTTAAPILFPLPHAARIPSSVRSAGRLPVAKGGRQRRRAGPRRSRRRRRWCRRPRRARRAASRGPLGMLDVAAARAERDHDERRAERASLRAPSSGSVTPVSGRQLVVGDLDDVALRDQRLQHRRRLGRVLPQVRAPVRIGRDQAAGALGRGRAPSRSRRATARAPASSCRRARRARGPARSRRRRARRSSDPPTDGGRRGSCARRARRRDTKVTPVLAVRCTPTPLTSTPSAASRSRTIGAEGVGPDERHEADARAEPRQPDGDVGRRAAELAMEDVALGERARRDARGRSRPALRRTTGRPGHAWFSLAMNSSDLSGRPTWSMMIADSASRAPAFTDGGSANDRGAVQIERLRIDERAPHLVDERAAVAVAVRADDAAAPHVEHVARAAELDGAAGDARFELRTQAERVEQAQLEDAQRLGARRPGLERGEEGRRAARRSPARAGAAGSARAPPRRRSRRARPWRRRS